MANRLFDPDPQFADETGAPYAGGSLNFFVSGSSTPLSTYTNSALTLGASTVVTLDGAGRPEQDIFLQNLLYKVVLEDANGVEIWTKDPVYTSDYSATAQFQVYPGDPNGHVAGSAGVVGGVNASAVFDTTNGQIYICTTSGTTTTAVWTLASIQNVTTGTIQPQGRLLLTNAAGAQTTPSTTGATAIYYMPYLGDACPIFNGATFDVMTFTGAALSLVANHLADTNYDIYGINNNDVFTLVTSPAWAGDNNRGSGAGSAEPDVVNGFVVNKFDMTARNGATTYTVAAQRGLLLGSVRMNGSNGQTDFNYGGTAAGGTAANLLLSNFFNEFVYECLIADSTDSWTYGTATWRAANNSSTMRAKFVSTKTSFFGARYNALISPGAGNIWAGIGVNTAAAASGTTGGGGSGSTFIIPAIGEWHGVSQIGLNFVSAIEYAQANGTYYGDGGVPTFLQTGLHFRGPF
jgi:hypothetical protein